MSTIFLLYFKYGYFYYQLLKFLFVLKIPFCQYNEYKTPMENIGMQDSLLSRFDLLFIVLDQANPDDDLRISNHVLSVHKYRAANSQDGAPLPLTSEAEIYSTNVASNKNHDEGLQIYDKSCYTEDGKDKKKK